MLTVLPGGRCVAGVQDPLPPDGKDFWPATD